MISSIEFTLLIVAIVASVTFLLATVKKRKLQLIHKLYFLSVGCMVVWMISLAGLWYVRPDNIPLQVALDAVMYVGAYIPALMLITVLTFVNGWTALPHKYHVLYVIPTLTNVMVWTNPLHGLFYEVFSLKSGEVVFGPYLYVSGIYSYVCMALAIILILRTARKASNKLYMQQARMFGLGILIPLIVNFLATAQLFSVGITATPFSYIATVIFHGIAIFRLHMFDVKPLAMQRVLDMISDCYLILSDTGSVVSYNLPFYKVFGQQYGIREQMNIRDCLGTEIAGARAGLYDLITAVDSCREIRANISYEHAVFVQKGSAFQKRYYMVDITPLIIDDVLAGTVVMFKDVTKVKESMQRLQDSKSRMMEQERLASLGQLAGGIAHNLKTPIMSVAGSATAMSNLVEECRISLGDPEVTEEDYLEIYGEMQDWLSRIQEASAYMSDIVSAVKGQAAQMNTSDERAFNLDDTLKRVSLLLRHELVGTGCRLAIHDGAPGVTVYGDINNMVQIVNNLVSNAAYAQKAEGGEIAVDISAGEAGMDILVKDRGCGVPREIRKNLFKQMVTSKGTMGTGLGLFISNSVMKAKFGGHIWYEENPGGGSIFGIHIPREYIHFQAPEDAREVSGQMAQESGPPL